MNLVSVGGWDDERPKDLTLIGHRIIRRLDLDLTRVGGPIHPRVMGFEHPGVKGWSQSIDIIRT